MFPLKSTFSALLISIPLTLPVRALSQSDTRHLLERTAFGGSPRLQQHLMLSGRHESVRYLLNKQARRSPLPRFSKYVPLKNMSGMAKKERRQQLRKEARELKFWWLRQMYGSDAPLREVMALFWHNHFTSSLKKVRRPELMARQNDLFYEHGMGNFKTLLYAVAKDPAMLIYLDGRANRKNKPNENFARELLELFTLGEGHYSETDVQAAARAFTGWSTNREGKFIFRRRQHDTGQKTFLGQTGPWKGEDILRILLEQPQTARWITTRLWLHFISPTPEPKQINLWAKDFQTHWNIQRLLQQMLSSDAFWEPAHRYTLVKSPVELTLNTMHHKGFSKPQKAPWKKIWRWQKNWGQDIFDPPNVKGWPTGLAWLDSQRLSQRQQWTKHFGGISEDRFQLK